MAISNSDIAAIPTYTDAELLTLTRKAIVDVLAGGQAYGVQGRQFTRADLAELYSTVQLLEQRINAAADTADGTALIRWGDAQ